MIQFFNVTYRFGGQKEALRNLSFELGSGEFAFAVGRSGAGKSTIFQLICADMPPSEGQIVVSGRNLLKITQRQIPRYRRQLGLLWQDIRLLTDRSVRDNVALALEVVGVSARRNQEQITSALELVGMLDYADEYPHYLTGLEQQKVALARAIINNPQVLVADEATGDLDPQSAYELIELIKSLHTSERTTLILTNDSELCDRFDARKLIINQGFMIEDSGAV